MKILSWIKALLRFKRKGLVRINDSGSKHIYNSFTEWRQYNLDIPITKSLFEVLAYYQSSYAFDLDWWEGGVVRFNPKR